MIEKVQHIQLKRLLIDVYGTPKDISQRMRIKKPKKDPIK
jgi:hypothetical protein